MNSLNNSDEKMVYHLLTNQTVLELSYQQITRYAENEFFEINLQQKLSKKTKGLVLKQIQVLIKKEMYCFYSKISMNHFSKKAKKKFCYNHLKDLVVQQAIVLLLKQILKAKFDPRPISLCVIEDRRNAKDKFLRITRGAIASTHFSAFRMTNQTAQKRFFSSLKSVIEDKRFLNLLVKWSHEYLLDLNQIFLKRDFTLYSVLRDLYLYPLDLFVLMKVKSDSTLSGQVVTSHSMRVKRPELIVFEALDKMKKKDIFPLILLKPLICFESFNFSLIYIRYRDFLLIASDCITFDFNSLTCQIISFCNSALHLSFACINWKSKDFKNMSCFGFEYACSAKLQKQKVHIQRIVSPKKFKIELSKANIISDQYKPIACSSLCVLYGEEIITWYSFFLLGVLRYYYISFNSYRFTLYLFHVLKWSLFHTFSKKHKKSLRKIVLKYSKNLLFTDKNNLSRHLFYEKVSIFHKAQSSKVILNNFCYVYFRKC